MIMPSYKRVHGTPVNDIVANIALAHETPQNIAANGYSVEVHHVTTEDGYILEMHRIPHGRGLNEIGPPVFIMHGLMVASHCFIALGTETGIAYNMADAGFDVWLGNARGTRPSRYHTTLNPDDSQDKFDFFDLSFEDIGLKDIPAMVDYILEHTNRDKLHYIGHSQGGTVFLVLTSLRPEYNEKFASVHLLAGVGYMKHFPFWPLLPVARLANVIYRLALRLGLVEIYIPVPFTRDVTDVPNFCTGDEQLQEVCDLLTDAGLMGHEKKGIGSIGNIFLMGMGGIATKQIVHFGQNINSKKFHRWDFGMLGNIFEYGQINPPEFDLSQITANVTMHYTISDILLDERDVLNMVEAMPNTVARRIARDTFRHESFIFSPDVKALVTDYIVDDMWRVESSLQDSEDTTDSSSSIFNISFILINTSLIISFILT